MVPVSESFSVPLVPAAACTTTSTPFIAAAIDDSSPISPNTISTPNFFSAPTLDSLRARPARDTPRRPSALQALFRGSLSRRLQVLWSVSLPRMGTVSEVPERDLEAASSCSRPSRGTRCRSTSVQVLQWLGPCSRGLNRLLWNRQLQTGYRSQIPSGQHPQRPLRHSLPSDTHPSDAPRCPISYSCLERS